MPRLTNVQYRQRHHELQSFWEEYQSLFAVVPVDLQRQIHLYYQPTKDLSDAELDLYRRTITKQRPNLPAKASKAYVRIEQVYRLAKEQAHGNPTVFQNIVSQHSSGQFRATKRGRGFQVTAIANPELDIDLLLQAFVSYAEDLARQEQGDVDREEAA